MKRQPRLPPIVRYVYVIGPTRGLQKIGMATDPRSRLAALQTASPVDLLIHAANAVPSPPGRGTSPACTPIELTPAQAGVLLSRSNGSPKAFNQCSARPSNAERP